jgi:hypothetical protein
MKPANNIPKTGSLTLSTTPVKTQDTAPKKSVAKTLPPKVHSQKSPDTVDCITTNNEKDYPALSEVVEKHGAEWTKANQNAILKSARFDHIEEAEKANGICWEACRQWVSHRAHDTWQADDTIYDIMSAEPEKIQDLLVKHQARNADNVSENYGIEGLERGPTQVRTYTCTSAVNLDSRKSILDAVFSPPDLYILTFAGHVGGHAIAFDTRGNDGRLILMDSNHGEITFAHDKIKNFREFFHEFWEVASYKGNFHKGDRTLTRYFVGDEKTTQPTIIKSDKATIPSETSESSSDSI